MQKSVNTIIQNGAGKYLLQMRDGTPGICNPLKWNFFGGSIDDSEDPIAGAARETKEELNIALDTEDFELLGELCPREDRLRNLDRDDFLRVWVDFKSDHITSWGDMIVWQLIAVYKK